MTAAVVHQLSRLHVPVAQIIVIIATSSCGDRRAASKRCNLMMLSIKAFRGFTTPLTTP
jgi:hypothetical protein